MTRDEALEEECVKYACDPYGEHDEKIAKLINKIYDDFESRTCENCKYFIDERNTRLQFCNARTEGGIIGWNGYGKDFGCNKFERIK